MKNHFAPCHHFTPLSPTIEQDFRSKRKGGGVAFYIDSNLQNKVRNDLNLGDNTNSIFVEIDRNQLKSKYNTVIGCTVYTDHSHIHYSHLMTH